MIGSTPRPGASVRRAGAVLLALLPLASAACTPEAAGPRRLVDLFDPDQVVDPTMVAAPDEAAVAWRFDAGELDGWRGVAGVADLRVDDGELRGTITGDRAILHVARSGGPAAEDQIHSLRVTLALTAGSRLAAELVGQPELPDAVIHEIAGFAGSTTWGTALTPGDEPRTYVMENEATARLSDLRHLVIVVEGAAGAALAVDEIQVVTAREHLAGIPSGPGWHGLKDIYREALVARSPETIRVPVELPADAWLDLDVGTMEHRPLTFQVGVDDGGARHPVLQRTVTTPHRWEATPVDLSRWAGRRVHLELSLDSSSDGTLGLWGSPVVRSRTPVPQAATPRPPVLDSLAAAEGPPQGVIVILADTLRRDHLSTYGYERATSPQLTRLARDGALFTDNVSPASWTKVASPSIFTSLVPTSHRVVDFSDRLSDAAVTLAEIYRDAGYATAAFSSVLFTGKFSNMHQGYEELHESASFEDEAYPSKTGREFVDRAIRWVEDHRDVPFFLFLHVFDPHDPFEPRPPYDALWADPGHDEAHARQQDLVREEIDDPLLRQFGMPTRADLVDAGLDPEEYVGHDIDWYDGSIRGMDVELGRFLERLELLGLHDRTAIAFLADHGEEFLEHGRTFHGQSVYGELTEVPLVLRAPGRIPAGLEIGETVRSIDLMPTLLELSGLAVPEFAQGQSLLPLVAAAAARRAGRPGEAIAQESRPVAALANPAAAWGWTSEPAVSEKARTEEHGAPPPGHTESYAILLDGWKLVHHVRRDEGVPEFELFDHRVDPLDLTDVAASHPEIVERLRGELDAYLERALAARLPEGESLDGLSSEELERLRALGYIR